MYYRMEFEIEGVRDSKELAIAGEVLKEVYDIAAKFMNEGGIEKFNKEWEKINGNFEDPNYIKQYDSYFKRVADVISMHKANHKKGIVYLLEEDEPMLICPDEGKAIIRGRKGYI